VSAESPLRDGAPAGFELIETLRWEPGGGFVRLERHLARLYASARALGFRVDPDQVGRVLAEAISDPALALRTRLVVKHSGEVQASTAPYQPVALDAVWTLRIARAQLDSTDPLLRHKTSRREVYVAARTEFTPQQADEVLLLNERGELCEGTITSLFLDPGDGGPLLTPPLACGLLAGVLRAELIDEGRATERILLPNDIAGRPLFAGNSLRGLIPASLAS